MPSQAKEMLKMYCVVNSYHIKLRKHFSLDFLHWKLTFDDR